MDPRLDNLMNRLELAVKKLENSSSNLTQNSQ